MAKASLKAIKESLIAQLESAGKKVDFYSALVEDYIFYETQERKMQADTKKRGMTYQATSAAGKTYEKDNPSVKNAFLYNKQKLQILKELGLSADKIQMPGDDDEL